jgi:uncharacterized membrane protein
MLLQRYCSQANGFITFLSSGSIMANIIFLVVAAILLIVSVYFLISYIKDQKDQTDFLTNESGEKKT